MTADVEFEAGHTKTIHNPLHNIAEDAFPNLESTIKESSADVPSAVYTNASANATDVDIDSLPWPKLEEFDVGPCY